jgi:hypothetical protein
VKNSAGITFENGEQINSRQEYNVVGGDSCIIKICKATWNWLG